MIDGTVGVKEVVEGRFPLEPREDGTVILYTVGIGSPLLPGNGLIGLEIRGDLGLDGKLDLTTLRVHQEPIQDFRSRK